MVDVAINGTDVASENGRFIQGADVEAQTRGTGLARTESAFQAGSPAKPSDVTYPIHAEIGDDARVLSQISSRLQPSFDMISP